MDEFYAQCVADAGGYAEGFIEWVNEVRAAAWDEGYQAGVHDERIAAGWDYPATPGRANPYKDQT